MASSGHGVSSRNLKSVAKVFLKLSDDVRESDNFARTFATDFSIHLLAK